VTITKKWKCASILPSHRWTRIADAVRSPSATQIARTFWLSDPT
jgi:hypothetical protein